MNYFFIVLKTEQLPQKYYDYFADAQQLITFELGKDANNPHFHIIMKTFKKINACREALKRIFEGKYKVHIEILKDINKSSMYIMKDDNIIFNNLYSSEEIEELRQKVKDWKEEKHIDKSQYNKYLIEIYEPLPEDADWNEIQEYTLKFLIENMTLDCKDMDKIIHRRKLNLLLSRFYPKRYMENYQVEFFKNNRIKEVQQVFFEKLFTNNTVLNEVLNMKFN